MEYGLIFGAPTMDADHLDLGPSWILETIWTLNRNLRHSPRLKWNFRQNIFMEIYPHSCAHGHTFGSAFVETDMATVLCAPWNKDFKRACVLLHVSPLRVTIVENG